jgi:large subunit ribosomal protein L14
MIQSQTILNVSDNSGAKTAVCIKVLGGYKKRYAYVGDFLVVSIRDIRNKNKSILRVKKGDVCKALVIRTKKSHRLKDGSYVQFSDNSISLVTKQGGPLGTRILGPVLKELKYRKMSKFISISAGSV